MARRLRSTRPRPRPPFRGRLLTATFPTNGRCWWPPTRRSIRAPYFLIRPLPMSPVDWMLSSRHSCASSSTRNPSSAPDPSHRGDLPLRKGRAIGWIGEALAPLRGQLTESDLRRLTLAIRSAAGIEPLVWLTDIAGLSRREAVQLMRWSASALLRSALAESDTTGLKVKPRRPVEGITRRKSSSGTPNPALSRRRRA